MPVAEEQTAIRGILEILRADCEKWNRDHSSDRNSRKLAEIKFNVVNQYQLEAFFKRGNTGKFDDEQIVRLKPPARDIESIAGIWCRWDFTQTPPKCGFYYGLWSEQPAFPAPLPPAKSDRHLAFVGYRFESPEDGNNHNFYHSQPCRSMGAKDAPVDQALPISQRDPTWPLAAENATELLLCLVTALYGMTGLVTLESTVQQTPSLRRNSIIISGIRKVLGLRHPKN